MKLTGTLSGPNLDLAGYLSKLDQVLTAAIQNAAREWLHATVVEVPVWSGASVATFLKLAAAVAFPLGVSPVTGAPNRIPLGEGASTGSLELDKGKGRYTFTYGTKLAHLIYNEFNNANTSPDPTLFGHLLEPGPYNFHAKGKDAFDRAAGGVRLPAVRDFIRETSVKVQ
jgi:hypothetical protein